MDNYKFFLFIVILIGLLCSCKKNTGFEKTVVTDYQKTLGLEFSSPALDTMIPYLKRNKRGFDSLRNYSLDFDVQPPLYFDPQPHGFNINLDMPQWATPIQEEVTLPDDISEIAFYPITKLARLIQNKSISSLDLTKMYLERLHRYNDTLQCVISFMDDYALKQANRADSLLDAGIYLGPLHGIPYGIKDLFAMEGYPTTWGSEPYKNQYIKDTATVIKKLEQAGAVLMAKLVSGALARGDVWFGGQTKNPWDTDQGASGSSAGSGSAMSAGLAAFTIGTETLGSIVSPANRNGVTGLRPTYGRVSKAGVMSLSWTMDKAGPLCRTAADCGIVLKYIAGYDAADPSTSKIPLLGNSKNLDDYKIGYLKSDFDKDTSASKGNSELAIQSFKDLGWQLEEVTLPTDIPYDCFDVILRAEAGAFFDELVRNGGVDDMVQQSARSRANSLRQSRFIPAVEYIQANRHRSRAMQMFHEIIKEYDVIISPTFGNKQLLLTNLTGHPAICIPTGLDDDGHPTSITLVGNLFDEASIVKVAAAFQDKTEHEELFPPDFVN